MTRTPLRSRIPIRARLTLWFVGIMGVTLVALSLFLSARFLQSLATSIDIGLKVSADQIVSGVDLGSELLALPALDAAAGDQLSYSGLAIRLVAPDGTVVDQQGDFAEQPVWGSLQFGYQTASQPGDDTQWRTLTEPIHGADSSVRGWVQVAQTLEVLTNTGQDVRDQLALMIPVLLIGLGAGGYFLAWRALRPIDEITQTAESISASDLSKRIGFSGPRDEVGRLAATFDEMLGRLQSAFERERRFSADAAHELRTPLSVLKGQLEVTLGRTRTPKEYEATLHGLNLQVGRLIELSDDLLLLARTEQRKLDGETSEVNLSDVLEAVLEQYRPPATERQIAIASQLPPEMAVAGSRNIIQRLFTNLMDNAVKYTPSGGRIAIQAGESDDSQWVEVFNSAMSLTDLQVEHLFERFYRVEPSRSRRSGGAGLGLAIAKEIVEALGWQISVEKQPNRGITFRTTIPRRLLQ